MTTKKTRIAAIVSLSAAFALALSACGGAKPAAEESGAQSTPAAASGPVGGINAGVAYQTTNYHPSSTSSALALGTNWQVVEGLWEFDMSDYTVHKALAAQDDPVKVSDTEYEVTLRDGAKFSDGTPVTTEDVVKSFERSTAEGNIYVSMLNFIDSVSAKDDKTVTIKLKTPFTLLKQRLPLVKIVPAKLSDDELTAKPVGTGPYMYENITEEEVTAVPNPNYNGGTPATAERIRWSVLKDDTARTTAAQDGTIDIMESVPADNVSLLEAAGWKVEKKPGFNLPFLIFNTNKAPFNDARVRQAFFYAIDTDKLIANNMSGEATAATSFLPKTNPAYHEAKNVFKYDSAKAKELLSTAGVNGLSITLLTTDHPWISNLAPQIKNDLEAAGIKVNIQSEASASLYSNNLDVDNATYDVALAPGDPSVFGNDPALLMNWWYGDNVWTQKRSFWKTSNPEAFEKLRGILSEAVALEGDAQQAKWNEAFDLLSEEVPLYPLFHRTIITGYNPEKVTNFKPVSTTGLYLIGASGTK